MTQHHSIKIRVGWSGAAFKVDKPAAIPGDVRIGPWQATLQGGLPFLTVEAETSMKPAEAVEKAREIAEKSLDLLATIGAGAYRIATDDSCVYWWTDQGQVHASIHGRFHIPFPWSMMVRHLDKPGRPAGHPQSAASWRAGFRYFRMAQTARDSVSAFRDTYLSVENLLADLFPRRTKPKRETERAWLMRALDSFNKSRPNVQGKDWLGQMGLGNFVDSIYTAVRHSIFHAKAGETFLLPLDATSDDKVRRADCRGIRGQSFMS
jgi:hypothetical protein